MLKVFLFSELIYSHYLNATEDKGTQTLIMQIKKLLIMVLPVMLVASCFYPGAGSYNRKNLDDSLNDKIYYYNNYDIGNLVKYYGFKKIKKQKSCLSFQFKTIWHSL